MEYFETHPVEKRRVEKIGMNLLRKEFEATHHFEYNKGETKCWVCGQDWHGEISRCPGFQKDEISPPEKIKKILRQEEELYARVLTNCRKMVESKYKGWEDLTGEEISILRHTHGCDVEVLEDIFNSSIPRNLREEYEKFMEIEKERSRLAHKKEIITTVYKH